MMTIVNLFANLFAMFGGVLFYFLILAIFKINISKMAKIGLFIIAIIPIIGTIMYIIAFIASCIMYQREIFYRDELVQPRDTKLNRWLFDDVDWKDYDQYNKN